MAPAFPPSLFRHARRWCVLGCVLWGAGLTLGGPAAFAQAQPSLDHLPAPHLSYGRLATYSGIVVDIDQPSEKTVFFDAAKYDGHLDFVIRALGRQTTKEEFLDAVSRPKSRRYFPFLLYRLNAPLQLGGRPVQYLLRPQRYRFQDDHAALAKLLASVVEKVNRATDNALGAGAVMLYDGDRRRPNANTADALAQAGLGSIGLSTLLAKVGGHRVSVLHPGVAVGRLVRVGPGETPRDFGPDVIAVYDVIPEVAPTFAGIITLEAQTPLSHINLLAKNRGTVNLSAQSIDDIVGLKENLGKPVRLVAKRDRGRGGEISLRPISTQALAAATRKARSQLAIPKPKRGGPPLLALTPPAQVPTSFDGARAQLVRRVGAKAAGYSLLYRLLGEEAVRPASALTFDAYLEHAHRSGAHAQIRALHRQRRRLSKEQVATRLRGIREAIEKTPLRRAVVQRLVAHLAERYRDQKVRLRSSTNCEDLPAFNGAGLYVSKGLKQKNVDDKTLRAKLERKLKAVFAALWTERAYWERAYAGIDQRDVAMAVLIHPAFVDEFGDGVALSLHNPGTPLAITVQAQRGGGGITHAKSGQTPETFVHHVGRSIPGAIQSRSSEGDVLLLSDPQTRAALALFLDRMAQVDAAFVPPSKAPSRKKKRTAGKGTRKVIGVDVEFKVMREDEGVRIYFKQARLLSTPLPGASPLPEAVTAAQQ